MAAHARAFGYCFNPISVFWCWDRARRAGRDRGRGAQHLRRPARLPRPPRRAGPGHAHPRRCTSRRSTAPTAPTTSPSRCPATTGSTRGHPAHRRRRQRSPPSLTGRRVDDHAAAGPHPPRSAAPLLIRMHGIWLWLRRLPVRPRPDPPPGGSPDDRLTRDRQATSASHWPGLDVVPDRAARRASPPGSPAGCSAPPSAGSTSPCTSATEHLGPGRPGRWSVHRPEEFFARLGRDQLIGFGEAYLTGAWDAEDLGGFLTVLAAEMPHLVPAPLQRLRALVVAQAAAPAAEQHRDTPATTSRTTTTCPTTCSRCSSTRR